MIGLPVLAQTRALPALGRPEILAVAAAYFVVCAAIAWWSTRRTRTAADPVFTSVDVAVSIAL